MMMAFSHRSFGAGYTTLFLLQATEVTWLHEGTCIDVLGILQTTSLHMHKVNSQQIKKKYVEQFTKMKTVSFGIRVSH